MGQCHLRQKGKSRKGMFVIKKKKNILQGERRFIVSSLFPASPLLIPTQVFTVSLQHCVPLQQEPASSLQHLPCSIFLATSPGLGRQLAIEGNHSAVQMDRLKE
jgi:hypothetical protein